MGKDRLTLAVECITEILGAEPIPRDPVIAAIISAPPKRSKPAAAYLGRRTAGRGLGATARAKANPSAATMRGKLGG